MTRVGENFHMAKISAYTVLHNIMYNNLPVMAEVQQVLEIFA